MTRLSDNFRQMAEYFRHMAVFGAPATSRDMYALSSVAESLGYATNLVDRGVIAASAIAIDWSYGAHQVVELTQNASVSFTGFDSGKQHYLTVIGAFSPSFSGISWVNGTTPTPTALVGRADIYEFMQVGNIIVGKSWGQNIPWT